LSGLKRLRKNSLNQLPQGQDNRLDIQ
jgi:hypothetical protein